MSLSASAFAQERVDAPGDGADVTVDAPAPGGAGEPPRRVRGAPLFSIHFENDWFGGTDRHYTNGAKLTWVSRDLGEWGRSGWQQRFLDALPFVNRPDVQKNIGFALGQNIYTPQDTDASVPDPADRPYAGWSYAALAFMSRSAHRMDTFELQVGMVGPHSYADDVQEWVHDKIGDDRPNGWAHQLEDEVGVNLIYSRTGRVAARAFDGALGLDLLPHAGFSVGNVRTYANAGGLVRAGFHLPSDFGVQLIGPPGQASAPLDGDDPRLSLRGGWSFFVFGGADGRAVARDLFLDGNTWEDSPSVDKEPFVADLYYGFGFIVRRFQLTFTQVVRTREFEGQDRANEFGSVTLSWTF